MDNNIQTIETLKAELKSLQPLKSEYQQKLDKKFRLEFNFNSNHLEGNTLTYGETKLLLLFDKTVGQHELRELEEMKAHDVAYEMIKEWAVDLERPLNETIVKNLNEVLLVRPFWKEAVTSNGQSTRRLIKVGVYKEYPNSVRLQNGEMFHYTSPEETPIKMGELIEWYRNEEEKYQLHPVELAAQLHYRFVCIHPFDDGNGRVSRLLMNYVLLKHYFPPVIIKSSEKKDYLFALNLADTGNLNAFSKYIAEQLLWSLKLAVKAAKGESLEEEDDIDKEIALWKRSLNDKADAIPKKNLLIFEKYNDSIRPLFKLFIDKHEQFSELFMESSSVTLLDKDKGGIGLEYLDHAVEDLKNSNQKMIVEEDEEIDIDEFRVGYVFKKFKKAGTNTFDYTAFLECEFNDIEWKVASNGGTILKKLYSQTLTSDEIKSLVMNCIKQTFESIQNKAGLKITQG